MDNKKQIQLIMLVGNIGVAVALWPRQLYKWFTLSAFFWLMVVLLGCSTTNKSECNWYCDDPTKVPDSCSCLEEMIDARLG